MPEPEPDEPLQPDAIPEAPPPSEAESGDPNDEARGIAGVPDGDPLGVPGGERDGVPHGVLEGPGRSSPADAPPQIVTPGMTPPVLVHRVEPEYPEAARAARLEGRAILQAVISAAGRVEEVVVLRSTNALFDAAAIDAVRQWEYEPARQGDRPVAVYFTIDVRFTLR